MKNIRLPIQVAFMFFISVQLNCTVSKNQFKMTSNLNDSPEQVMMTIFNVAKSQEFEILKGLLPPEGKGSCDGDCKALCNPGNENMKKDLGHNYITSAEFIQYFSSAKIIGEAEIKGDMAKVKFIFGENNKLNETMNMQRIEGKWYLKSF